MEEGVGWSLEHRKPPFCPLIRFRHDHSPQVTNPLLTFQKIAFNLLLQILFEICFNWLVYLDVPLTKDQSFGSPLVVQRISSIGGRSARCIVNKSFISVVYQQ